MAEKRRELFRERILPAIGRSIRKYAVLVSLMGMTLNAGCPGQTAKPEASKGEKSHYSCYDYKDGILRVYVEKDPKKMGRLGQEFPLQFSELGITEKGEPLAYFCTYSGHLFWVTPEDVHIRKISIEKGTVKVEKVLDERHVDPDEYKVPGTRVISADIWHNPEERWQRITVATLTNTGLFQAARYSVDAQIDDNPKRGIYNLMYDNHLKKRNRWPQSGIKSGAIGILSGNEFSIIPLGEQGKDSVVVFYYIENKGADLFSTEKWNFHPIRLTDGNPDLKNIFAITKPIRYEKKYGGWIVNLLGERANETMMPLFPQLIPVKK